MERREGDWNGFVRIAFAGILDVRKRHTMLAEKSISTTVENYGTMRVDKGQPESSGCGGIVFALSDGSNPVTFVISGTRREIAKRICGRVGELWGSR